MFIRLSIFSVVVFRGWWKLPRGRGWLVEVKSGPQTLSRRPLVVIGSFGRSGFHRQLWRVWLSSMAVADVVVIDGWGGCGCHRRL